jgi:hypothetical protein
MINKLTPTDYSERDMGGLKIDNYNRPYTLNFSIDTNLITFDCYTNKFFFAGVRRIAGLLNK